LKNKFYKDVQNAYADGATVEGLKKLLGRARAKRGMFEGDLNEGELEIGQVSGLIHEIKPAATIVEDLMTEFNKGIEEVKSF
ncbi:MAG: nitronate monooxygenase, partial [Bacteroidota bacterium]